jgi:hypothetical protein
MILARHDRPSKDPREIEAHFAAYQARSTLSSTPSSPHPPHEETSKRRHSRRRTTDGAERTKSSKLPLERTPHDYRIQDHVLLMETDAVAIMQGSQKLEMRTNSLEWEYNAEGAYDVFVEPVTTRKVMEWVIQLDGILHEKCERVDAVDTRSLLHEAIQKGLDVRRGKELVVDMVEYATPGVGSSVVGKTNDDVRDNTNTVPKNDGMSDFDLSQFVDVDLDNIDDEAPVSGTATKVDDEFGDDIEDEMLMDI